MIFVLGWLEQPGQDKNLLYRHDEPNEPTKDSQQGPPVSGLSGLDWTIPQKTLGQVPSPDAMHLSKCILLYDSFICG